MTMRNGYLIKKELAEPIKVKPKPEREEEGEEEEEGEYQDEDHEVISPWTEIPPQSEPEEEEGSYSDDERFAGEFKYD